MDKSKFLKWIKCFGDWLFSAQLNTRRRRTRHRAPTGRCCFEDSEERWVASESSPMASDRERSNDVTWAHPQANERDQRIVASPLAGNHAFGIPRGISSADDGAAKLRHSEAIAVRGGKRRRLV